MGTNDLKNFFKKNLSGKESGIKKIFKKEETGNFSKEEYQTYEDWGFESAKQQQGGELAFLGRLSLVREHYRRTKAKDEGEQKKIREKATEDLAIKQTDTEQKQNKIDSIKNDLIEPLKTKIENLKKDIIKIKENPSVVMDDKMSKASFVIGLIILSILTIYLFVFYSSASYSALFKKFTLNEIGVANSIFDPKAISIAYQDGITELILILCIPAIFLGLGFLIHKFQEQEGFGKYLKITALVIITFIFDAILAYEITEKIYNIKAQNSFQDMPDYTISMAFQSVNFWLIIFAGFIVYIIWGFVFDFVMESYDKLDIVNQAIKAKQTEIKIYEKDIDNHQTEIKKLQDEINEINLECVSLRKIIDEEVIIIDWTAYEKVIHEFTGGWTQWMVANRIENTRIDQIHQASHTFVKNDKKNQKI